MGTRRFWFGLAALVAAAGFVTSGYALDSGWARLYSSDGGTIADPNGTCPHLSTDNDCSGYTNLLDVARLVNTAFRNADPATSFCRPCAL